MAEYVVGQIYSGRISLYRDCNLYVELETGDVGRIPNIDPSARFEQGAHINVVMLCNDPKNLVFDFVRRKPAGDVSANDAKSADHISSEALKDKLNLKPWENWQSMPDGHNQALTAIVALRTHTDSFRRELSEAGGKRENAKRSYAEHFNSATVSINKQYEDEVARYNREYEEQSEETSRRKKTVETVQRDCDSFVSRASSSYESVKNMARSYQGQIKNMGAQVENAIQAKIQAYDELRKFKIAQAEKRRNDSLNAARNDQIRNENGADDEYRRSVQAICERNNRDIESGFNKSSLIEYQSHIMSSRFNAESYSCSKVVPDCVMLGYMGLMIPNMTEDDRSVIQTLENQTAGMGYSEAGSYIVKIPYTQKLEEGISLLIRYSQNDIDYAHSVMQPLLLKLFMAFPPGKLEATMIDPLKLGASFSDILLLDKGPNSAKAIDTKIWSKEKDIESAIAALRQNIENLTQSYGEDRESRLKKETVRALAITDFPEGFSDAALKDLHAIVRNSASRGVCVFICANDVELARLREKNETLMAEITQSMVETVAAGNKLMLSGNFANRIFIEPDMMQDVMRNKDTIMDILSTAIEHSAPDAVKFEDMFGFDIYNCNKWGTGRNDELSIPLGIRGANTVVQMIMGRTGGSTQHHALIAGPTGAGKSTLLHTLVLSSMISYSPKDLQIYLLDFKEGVEFNIYTQYRLPSLRVVALNSEREFGLHVLRELCTELETRTKAFSCNGVTDINSYQNLGKEPRIPRLLMIFDEVQELFRNDGAGDSISAECLSCIGKLVRQGRAMGIHIILACQDFRNCAGLDAFFSHMAIRIAIRGSEEGITSILKSDNSGAIALRNKPAGTAIYNDKAGDEEGNTVFRVSYLESKERVAILAKMEEYYCNPAFASDFKGMTTRVLLTDVENDVKNCFNRLIYEGNETTIQPLSSTQDAYGLILGQGFGKQPVFITEMKKADKDNILIVTPDEKMALSLFIMSALSILYEELKTMANKKDKLVYVIDLFDEELADDFCNFDFLGESFPQQTEIIKKDRTESFIESLYNTLMNRIDGKDSSEERLFLMFFGINRARMLRVSTNIYGNVSGESLNAIDMLIKILEYGPKYGINCIMWSEYMADAGYMLGERYQNLFAGRIAYDLDENSMNELVAERDNKTFMGKTAVFMNILRDVKNTHFRPYNIPSKEWIKNYAEAYAKLIK